MEFQQQIQSSEINPENTTFVLACSLYKTQAWSILKTRLINIKDKTDQYIKGKTDQYSKQPSNSKSLSLYVTKNAEQWTGQMRRRTQQNPEI